MNAIKEYVAAYLLTWLENKIRRYNAKLKKLHAKHYEKTGKWVPLDDEHEDF